MSKVVEILDLDDDNGIIQGHLICDDGIVVSYAHASDCCEVHYLDFEHLTIDDFDGADFDFGGDDFFERVCRVMVFV